MKSNSLEDILRVLKAPEPSDKVIIKEAVRQKALKSLEAMFEYAEAQPSKKVVCE
jgi:quinolinate synthase